MRAQHFTAMLSTLLLLILLPEYVQADKTLQIRFYNHQGCTPTAGVTKILPLYPHIGDKIGGLTFQYSENPDDAWRGVHKCNWEVHQKKKSCELATKPSEHLLLEWRQACADQYRAEIATCRGHYEREKTKCDLLAPKTEREAQDRKKIENVAGGRPKDDASKHPVWEELVPSDELAPGWEELTGEDDNEHGVARAPDGGGAKRKQRRGDLIRKLRSKHQDAARSNRDQKVEDRQRLDQQNLPMGQAAVQQGNMILLQSIQKLTDRRLSQASGDSSARCHRINEQIAARMRSRFSIGDNGICAAGREQLRMLTFTKDNLSRHGCYSGEYDQVISETRNYIAQAC